MLLEGLILDESDITQETKRNRGTGEETLVGYINLITTKPTDTIRVSIPADIWNGGECGKVLKQLVGKRVNYAVRYNDMSFANENGQHVSFNGFQLYAAPELPQSK